MILKDKMQVPFYVHSLQQTDFDEVLKALQSPFLTRGSLVHQVEKRLAELTENECAVGLMSCTHALSLALHAHGIGPGDEVITTPMTFVATVNAILHSGATPVFVDVEPETGNIDATQIANAITPATKTILPVHLYGVLCDMRALRKIADDHGLILVEDAAHCVEGVRDGVRPGNLSDMACFSFYATKNLTSGEGGAIALHDPELAQKLVSLSLHGMSKPAEHRFSGKYVHWDVEQPGFKMNMSNVQAAILLNQFGRIESQRQRREKICQRYETAFADIPKVGFPTVPEGATSGRHLFTIWVDERDRVIKELGDRGIGVTVNYRSVHRLKFYQQHLGYASDALPVAGKIGDQTISLPLYPGLTDSQIDYVIRSVIEVVQSSS